MDITCPKFNGIMIKNPNGICCSTEVYYDSPVGHNHDDNCFTVEYMCSTCGHKRAVSPINYCPSCDWKGESECFCSIKVDVNDLPDDFPKEEYVRDRARVRLSEEEYNKLCNTNHVFVFDDDDDDKGDQNKGEPI